MLSKMLIVENEWLMTEMSMIEVETCESMCLGMNSESQVEQRYDEMGTVRDAPDIDGW
jgi:hypothetical protein